jgi:hypothetical protein
MANLLLPLPLAACGATRSVWAMRTGAKRMARLQAKAVMKKDDESIAEEIDVVGTPEFLSCVSPTHKCMCVVCVQYVRMRC